MTALQTVEISSTDDLVRVGYNLSMARDDLCGVIAYGGANAIQSSRVLVTFLDAIHEASFGAYALRNVETAQDAAEVIVGQLGCLAGKKTILLEEIVDRVEDWAQTRKLPEAMEYTIESLIGPLLWPAEST